MKKLYMIIIAIVLSTNGAIATPIIDEAAEQYVQIVLALGQHDEAYVDAYYGPEELQKSAKLRPMKLETIIVVAKMLQNVVEDQRTDDEMVKLRLSYLKAQLSALTAKALMLSGRAEYDFDQESKALYDTQAPTYELQEFDKILEKLAVLLPGDGTLSSRVEKFQSQFIIPKNKLQTVFDAAIKACRERTKPFVKLLENENFTLEFVTDKPWSGYNWYKGNAYSLIQVNTELPIQISRAIDLGCHEGYPGHHTYNSLLEANLYIKRGWIEYSVYPLFSPQSLIAEGSANYGIEMAFPGNKKIEFEKKELFPLAGIKPELAEQYDKLSEHLEKLNYAGNEVARLYINKKIDAAKAQAMLQHYSLMSEKKAKQRVKFIDAYGAYVINYNWGKDLVKNWVEAGDDQSQLGRWKRFTKLLSSPLLPSTLN